MQIDYKAAYNNLHQTYMALLRERMETASLPALLDWINNPNRKQALLSFTEGPERQIAYAVEDAIRNAKCVPCETVED